MPFRGRKTEKRWSLYPALHKDVSLLLEEHDLHFQFYDVDSDNFTKSYDTNILGRFKCHNDGCKSDGWSSKKIAITIRMYPNKNYNARVYHQRCKSCNRLSRPILDKSYAERVAYRIKKWSDIQVEAPNFTRRRSAAPHSRHLCEGCRHGHCRELDWTNVIHHRVEHAIPTPPKTPYSKIFNMFIHHTTQKDA